MSEVIIYHNPRCSKSRQTLQLLEDKGIQPKIVEYLKSPPSKTELQKILKMLNMSARDIMRKKEAEYKSQKLDNDALSETQLIDAMIQTPSLIERPIVVHKSKAAIGRPPENILEIL